jgi:hypothetical protein
MSFKKNKYVVMRQALSQEMAWFCYNYFQMKRRTAETLFKTSYLSNFAEDWGHWHDSQAPETYSHYADMCMETLLHLLKPGMEKMTKLKLIETYSYARIYKRDDVLLKHTDRKACAVSATLHLGGDILWPLFLKTAKNKTVKVILKPGDMLIYDGCDLPHWRDSFQGSNCVQVFLHYNKLNPKNLNAFDERLHLGLPAWFKGRFKNAD